MAINAKDLPTKTTPSSNDAFILGDVSTNRGSKIDFEHLLDSVLGHVDTGEIVPISPTTVYASSTDVKQIGNLVVGYVALQNLPAATGEQEVATLTGVDFPSKLYRGNCGIGPQLYEVYYQGYFNINNQTGKITVKKTSATQTYNCAVLSFAYIV